MRARPLQGAATNRAAARRVVPRVHWGTASPGRTSIDHQANRARSPPPPPASPRPLFSPSSLGASPRAGGLWGGGGGGAGLLLPRADLLLRQAVPLVHPRVELPCEHQEAEGEGEGESELKESGRAVPLVRPRTQSLHARAKVCGRRGRRGGSQSGGGARSGRRRRGAAGGGPVLLETPPLPPTAPLPPRTYRGAGGPRRAAAEGHAPCPPGAGPRTRASPGRSATHTHRHPPARTRPAQPCAGRVRVRVCLCGRVPRVQGPERVCAGVFRACRAPHPRPTGPERFARARLRRSTSGPVGPTAGRKHPGPHLRAAGDAAARGSRGHGPASHLSRARAQPRAVLGPSRPGAAPRSSAAARAGRFGRVGGGGEGG